MLNFLRNMFHKVVNAFSHKGVNAFNHEQIAVDPAINEETLEGISFFVMEDNAADICHWLNRIRFVLGKEPSTTFSVNHMDRSESVRVTDQFKNDFIFELQNDDSLKVYNIHKDHIFWQNGFLVYEYPKVRIEYPIFYVENDLPLGIGNDKIVPNFPEFSYKIEDDIDGKILLRSEINFEVFRNAMKNLDEEAQSASSHEEIVAIAKNLQEE